MTRRLTALLLALILAAPPLALAQGDNSAVAVNTKDGSSLFELAFDIRRVAGDVVDQTNLALAYSSCEGCQTVAIAIQILIVTGSPEVLTPQNVAIAINELCTTCTTLALAYQFVFGGDRTFLTPQGRREINRIRRAFYRLRSSGLTPLEIAREADRLAQRLRDVLSTQLVSRPPGDHDDSDDEKRYYDQRGPDAYGDGGEETVPYGGGDGGVETVPEEPQPQPAPEPAPDAAPPADERPPTDTTGTTATPPPESPPAP